MSNVGEVILDERHEERQTQHDEEACEEDPDKIVITPGSDPVLLGPLTPLECRVPFWPS